MIKLLLPTLIWVFASCEAISQDMRYSGDFQLIGNDNDSPVFRLHTRAGDTKHVFKTRPGSEGFFGFYPYKTLNFPSTEIEFVYDDIFLRRYKAGSTFKNILFYGENDSLEIKNWKISDHIFYPAEQKKIFLFLYSNFDYMTVEISFGSTRPSISYIPLKGDRAYLNDDWLYFSFFHENYEYSPYPHDIFRVKIGDWSNTELVFECSEYDEWFLYPEHHVVGTDVALDVLANEDQGKQEILYEIEKKSFAIVPNISRSILKYQGKYYNYYPKQIHTHGIETIHLEPLPKLPTEYGYVDKHHCYPREVWYNVPLNEKVFDGTFVTPYLLREAPAPELEKLDKAQLKLLRNSIFAQYGYLFNSNDLQEFYNQFEWYRMMTVKKKNNDDVVLLPEDESRTELIKAVEESKQ